MNKTVLRLALLAVCSLPIAAIAQPVPASAPGPVSFPVSTLRNVATFGNAPISSSSVPRYAFAVATNGLVVADAATGLPLPSGQTTPITIKSSIPKASTSAAIGRFLRKGVPILGTGVALYDLAQELGYVLETNGGTVTVKQTTQPPAGYDGFEYKEVNTAIAQLPYVETKQLACDAWALYRTNTNMFQEYRCRNANTGPVNGQTEQRAKGSTGAWGIISDFTYARRTDLTPFVPTLVETTPRNFELAITDKNEWQPSSALGRALVDAIKAGEIVSPPVTQITGPASSPGPLSTSQTGDVTTQSSTEYNHTYQGNRVTTNITNTTTSFTTSTGATISSTTTTTTPEIPQPSTETEPPDPPCGIPGKPPCDVKIDETGTPSDGANRLDDDKTNFNTIRPTFDQAISDIDDISAPDWTWTFALPTGCSPLPMGAFGFEIDICEFQPTIHDLMSLVWVAAGIFGLLGLLRNALGVES